jgi:8-oxo-dGTP pyrophosphatase MutT (NUDIX family)
VTQMADLNEKTSKIRLQYACLPYRVKAGNQVEFMLVTSRETKRWVIPKGWPMKGKKPHAGAAREALEEAGLVGQVGREPIGSYDYQKRLKGGAAVPCRVEVFPLAVKSQRKSWPEKGQRTLRWFSTEEAAEAVDEPELRDLIRQFGERLTATREES